MNIGELEKALQIRYMRLRIQVIMQEDTELPSYKSFALRGGIGEMLLRQNCIYDREKCENCGFIDECIVRRIMYAKPENPIFFMKNGESLGYNLECTDYRKHFGAGDSMEFHLVLFGKCISYFWQYLQAIHALGKEGIGKEKSRFKIYQILNIRKEQIVSDNCVYKNAYEWETIGKYVERRLPFLKKNEGSLAVHFLTPATIKHHGEFQQKFQSEAFVKALLRRIYMMDCFEGIGEELMEYRESLPTVVSQKVEFRSIRRFSSTQGKGIYLKGLEGEMKLEGVSNFLLVCIAAGEVLHVGKNTSFGFGMYRIKEA